jgi:hypothetical protein
VIPIFLSPFGAPALACWAVLFPPESWAFLTVGLPGRGSARTPTGFPRSACARCDRGGCPLCPGDGGVHTADQVPPAAACRFAAASPAPRSDIPSPGLTLTRRHQGFAHAHPSGLPLTCDPRTGRGSLGLNPELRTPPLPATHVRAGTGPNTGPSYATNITDLHPRSHSPHATSCRTTWKVLLNSHGYGPQQSTSLPIRGTFQPFNTPSRRSTMKAPG